MCILTKVTCENMVEKLGVISREGLKITFVMYSQKDKSGQNYVCNARITDKSEQITYSFTVPVTEEKTPIKFSVEAKKYLDVLSSLLSFEKEIAMNVSDSQLSLSVEGTATLMLPTVESVEEIVMVKEKAIVITMEGKAFNTLFRKGGFAVDKNSAKAACKAAGFSGVLTEKSLTVTSSDAVLVAYATGKASGVQAQEGVGDSFKVAIPESSLQKMLKLAAGAQSVNMMFTQTQMAVATPGSMFEFTLANESMEVEPIIEKWDSISFSEGATVDSEAILNAINVLSVADEKAKAYELSAEDTFSIKTVATDQKVAIAPSETLGDFSNKSMGISKAYLEKIVKNLNKGNVTIRTTNSPQVPFVFTNGTCSEPTSSSVCYVMKCNLAQVAPKTE